MPPIGVSQVKNPNLTMSFTLPRSRHVEFEANGLEWLGFFFYLYFLAHSTPLE